MSVGSALEAFDGLLDAVENEADADRPAWITAYRQLFVDQLVDGHHTGFVVGLARAKDRASSERWMTALATVQEAPGHRWALEATWALPNRRALPPAFTGTIGPMLHRVHAAVEARSAEENHDPHRAMRRRQAA